MVTRQIILKSMTNKKEPSAKGPSSEIDLVHYFHFYYNIKGLINKYVRKRKMSIDKIIQEIKKAVNKWGFCASEEIKEILLNNCSRRLTEECDLSIGELMSLYYKGSNFIVFKQETTHRKGNKLYDAFELKIIGPHHERLLDIRILGPVLMSYEGVVS